MSDWIAPETKGPGTTIDADEFNREIRDHLNWLKLAMAINGIDGSSTPPPSGIVLLDSSATEWPIPPGLGAGDVMEVWVFGGGQGGQSGAVSDLTHYNHDAHGYNPGLKDAPGGWGGGSGGWSHMVFTNPELLPDPVPCQIGAGGAGAPAQSTLGDAVDGAPGGVTWFLSPSTLWAGWGLITDRGRTAAYIQAGIAQNNGSADIEGSYHNYSGYLGSGGKGADTSPSAQGHNASPGGPRANQAASPGGLGEVATTTYVSGHIEVTSRTAPTKGTDGSDGTDNNPGGGGGGGGGVATTTTDATHGYNTYPSTIFNGANGGKGGNPGGGGGGGAGGYLPMASGAGGDGGDGAIVIVYYRSGGPD